MKYELTEHQARLLARAYRTEQTIRYGSRRNHAPPLDPPELAEALTALLAGMGDEAWRELEERLVPREALAQEYEAALARVGGKPR